MRLRAWVRKTLTAVTVALGSLLIMVDDVSPRGLVIMFGMIAVVLSNIYVLDNY